MHHRVVRVVLSSISFVLLCTSCGAPEAPAAAATQRVMLLHGLGRGASSMEALADHLREAGFAVNNFDYPSTDHEPEVLVEMVAEEVRRCCESSDAPLHFVTHSLGGILTRAYLAAHVPSNLGRVVMLAPPNKGSEIVDTLGENPVFEAILGPTAPELGTDSESLPRRLGPPGFEVGIIAGTSSINPVGSALLPGPSDGTVTVESARLEGAADFLLVDASHTFIMQDDSVAEQVIHFLRHGRFDHAAAGSSAAE
jgi:hypothetical protein